MLAGVTVIDCTGTTCGCCGCWGWASIFTCTVKIFSPALASIVVSPAPIIVTLPLLSTVTTCSFLESQVTVLLVAFDGSTVAVNCTGPSPTFAVMLAGVTVIDCTGTTCGCCGCWGWASIFTCTVKVFSPALASIVVSPAPIIVTLPLLSTVTTCSFLDIQVTVLLVAFDGNTVAVNCTGPSPTFALRLAGVTVIDCTGTSKTAWIVSFCVRLDSV